MTRRLYYSDATLRRFTAHVIGRKEMPDSEGVVRPALRLDRTAFYPTSGGQPHDTGTLAGIPVVDVRVADDDTIWHLLEALPLADDDEIIGEIDWRRRFDHMQQHSGQHLLSAAFDELLDGHTVGFHLGGDASTIDLDLDALSWEAVGRVERWVNVVIWENRPVQVALLSQAAATEASLRKPPTVDGDVRVVSVDGFDASACGGTHVSAAGEIGIVKVTSIERYKGGTRVTFLCGGRALAHYQEVLREVQNASLALTVGSNELVEAVERLRLEAKRSRREVHKAQEELAAYRADALWRSAPTRAGMRVVVAHWTDRAFSEARALAATLRERTSTVALLSVEEQGRVRLVCTRSEDLDHVDASVLLRKAISSLGGRGGGQPAIAQGGAPTREPEAVLAALHQALDILAE